MRGLGRRPAPPPWPPPSEYILPDNFLRHLASSSFNIITSVVVTLLLLRMKKLFLPFYLMTFLPGNFSTNMKEILNFFNFLKSQNIHNFNKEEVMKQPTSTPTPLLTSLLLLTPTSTPFHQDISVKKTLKSILREREDILCTCVFWAMPTQHYCQKL